MTDTGDPFLDLRRTAAAVLATAAETALAPDQRPALAGMEPGGALATSYGWLAAAQRTETPDVKDTHLVVFLASYAKASPLDAVRGYGASLKAGKTPANLLCVDGGLGLRVMDLASERPFTVGDFSPAHFVSTAAYGMEAAATEGSVLGLSDAAFGNEIFAIAILMALYPSLADAAAGDMPADIFEAAKAISETAGSDAGAFNIACTLGGPDIAAAIGAVISALATGQAVIFDGFACLAAYHVLLRENPALVEHCRFAGANTALEAAIANRLDTAPLVAGYSGGGPASSCGLAWRQLKAATDLAGLRA